MRPKGRRLIWEQQSFQARKKGVLYELWQKGAVWGQGGGGGSGAEFLVDHRIGSRTVFYIFPGAERSSDKQEAMETNESKKA